MSKKDDISHVKFQYKVAWGESIPALEWINKYTPVFIVLSYRGPCGCRLWVFVERQHTSEENRPRLAPVFPETGEKKTPITATEQSNEEIQVGKRHTTPNLKSKIVLPVNKKP